MFVRAALIALLSTTILTTAQAVPKDVGWTTNGGDTSNTRYAPLTDITPENAKTLGGTWRTQLPGASWKAWPIVRDGVMYVAAGGAGIRGGGGAVYALDAKTGAIKWTYSPEGAVGISALNKGV